VTDTQVVDANVVLRYLSADDPELYIKAKTFFDAVRAGNGNAYAPEFPRPEFPDRTKAEEPDDHEESPGEFLFQP
jgi:hypothetical protein